jgi:uncharacterized protein (TIGR02246 family)
MLSSRHIVVTLAVVALAACAAPQPKQPAVDVAAEAQAVRDASAAWMAAAQAQDAAAIDALMDANVTTIFDGEVNEGIDAVRAEREEEWNDYPDGVVSWNTTDVGVSASGDLAYERGEWSFDPDGPGEEPQADGAYLTVWKKTDGQWKVIYDAGTTYEDEDEAEDMD